MTHPAPSGEPAATRRERRLLWIPIDGSPARPGDRPLLEEPFPPREPGDFVDLTSSVRLHGVLSPLLLREVSGALQVVCGYRRYLAAKAAGEPAVPAMVARLEDAAAIRAYLSENTFRRPMGIEPQGRALAMLKDIRDEAGANLHPRTSKEERLELQARGGLRRRSLAPPPEAGEPRPARGETGALLGSVESLLAEIQATRSIPVDSAELLTDRILSIAADEPYTALRPTGVVAPSMLASHSLLVAALCARAAELLEWDGGRTRDFVLGGLLHDAAMVFVRTPALRSSRGLELAEHKEVQSHTRIGHALVTAARAWSPEVALCVLDHHERWNGTGYPSGKVGADVSPKARLLACLDTYAALISPRLHRDALTLEFAMERLYKAVEIGLFDPQVLPLLEQVLEAVPAPDLALSELSPT